MKTEHPSLYQKYFTILLSTFTFEKKFSFRFAGNWKKENDGKIWSQRDEEDSSYVIIEENLNLFFLQELLVTNSTKKNSGKWNNLLKWKLYFGLGPNQKWFVWQIGFEKVIHQSTQINESDMNFLWETRHLLRINLSKWNRLWDEIYARRCIYLWNVSFLLQSSVSQI